MGCGCLGPKQRRFQVYMEIIQSIHQEVQKITFVQSDTLDFYHAIKDKMIKKGLIRKLIDNLASHRNKINDSLHHNLQITLQKSNIENKYAGLLIIDSIIQGVYQKKQQKMQQTQQFSSKSQSKSQQNSDFRFIKKNTRSIPHSINLQNSMMREVDSRFDLIYFKMVMYFFQTQPKMYSRVLKSLTSFCKNRKQNFICVDYVWETLAFIMTKIKKRYYLPESTQAYSFLLEKAKQNFKDYQVEADLSVFIHLWLLDYSQNSKLKFGGTLQTAEQELVKINAIKVIQKYFQDAISNWNSNFLYSVIIQLYDQYQFIIEKLNSFESIMQSIALKNDLNYHFFRGLIISLLQYLNFSSQNKKSSNIKNLSSGTSLQEFKGKNTNVYKISVKLNAFKTLRRWISKKFMDLNEIVNYNCCALVFSYVDALSEKTTDFSNEICKQFLKLTRQYLSINSRQIVVLSLIQRVKWQQTQPKIRSLIIILIRQVFEDGNMFQNNKDSFDYIIILEPYYSIENSIQIIQLMGFMIKSVSKKLFINMEEEKIKDNDEADNFKHKLCQLLYSCYFLLIDDQSQTFYFKYQFCCAMISILKILYDNNCFSLIYSYEIELQRKNRQSKKIMQSRFYFIIWIAHQIKHLLFNKFRLPQQMLFINKKISTNSNEKQVQGLILTFLDNYAASNGSQQKQSEFKFQFQYKLKNNQKNLKIFDNFFNQKNERKSRIMQSMYEQGGFTTARGYSTTNYFPKRDSVNQSCDVSLPDDDKSFKDIMEVLQN